MEVTMISKMKYVGLFIACMCASVHANKTSHDCTPTITTESISPDIMQMIPADKQLLIDEIISLVSPYLSQEEMIRLISLLQDLRSKITLQTLEEIRERLTPELVMFYMFAKLGMQSAPESSTSTMSQQLEKTLEEILEKIRLSQYEKFIRTHAGPLSKIIRAALEENLSECLQPLVDVLTTVNKIEHPETLQAVLSGFLAKHSDALPTL